MLPHEGTRCYFIAEHLANYSSEKQRLKSISSAVFLLNFQKLKVDQRTGSINICIIKAYKFLA